MEIGKEVSLLEYNTLGIDAQAEWFIRYDSIEDLRALARDEYFASCRHLHIGGGSNLLFLANFRGIVLYSQIGGIECLEEDAEHGVLLRVGAGVVWDDLVSHCCQQGYWGIENLSLIPGQVGAAAIQNIGAYGVEISESVERIHAFDVRRGEERIFEREECNYTYRYSVFKTPEYSDWVVTHVELRLSLTASPRLDYADLRTRVGQEHTLIHIREVISSIRRSKLPDPSVLGNAGSYFVNPIVPVAKLEELRGRYPDIPSYPAGEGKIKLSAAWLIDTCGYRGYREGNVGVYERQALVLVNYGGATGTEIARLAEMLQQEVKKIMGVDLEPEVRYIS